MNENKEKTKGIENRIKLPNYTLGEELWNSISHGLGAIFGIIALVFLILKLVNKKTLDGYEIASYVIYSISCITLYTISCIYHALAKNNGKRVLRILDHDMVFFLVAGTYTPFCLVALREYYLFSVIPLGWLMFALVWALTALGITFNSINLQKYSKLSMILYIGIGWLIVFACIPLIETIGGLGFGLLLGGGILYTIGSVLYGIGSKKKWMHSVFHFFVLGASILQFLSIYFTI